MIDRVSSVTNNYNTNNWEQEFTLLHVHTYTLVFYYMYVHTSILLHVRTYTLVLYVRTH